MARYTTMLLAMLLAAVASQVHALPGGEDVAEADGALMEAAEDVAEVAEAAVEEVESVEAVEAVEAPVEAAESMAEPKEAEAKAAEEPVEEPAEAVEDDTAAAVEAESPVESEPPPSSAEDAAAAAAVPRPVYPPHAPSSGPPACAANSSRPWCLEDADYPAEMIRQAIAYHHYAVLSLYQDVVADTENSVDRLTKLEEETYLCSSEVGYVQPLRAVNTDGDWRVIVNGVKVHYDTFTQTVRLEECLSAGTPCPLVPQCYESSCHQKSAYHRMLVFDYSDYYQPFAVETFRLPSVCACALGAYEIEH